MDGFHHDILKPPKDWDERKNLTIVQLKEATSYLSQNLKFLGGKVKDTTSSASEVIINKTSEAK